MGSVDQKLYAIDADGMVKWDYLTGSPIFASVAVGGDGTIYVGSLDGNFNALNPDGTWKWSFSLSGSIVSAPAIGRDGTIYASTSDGKLFALNPNGSLKWSSSTGSGITAQPAIGPNGFIYVGSVNNNLYAVKPDGTLAWKYTTQGKIYGSPVIASDGTIYFGSYDKRVYALGPDGNLKWSHLMVDSVGAGPTLLENGDVLIVTEGKRLCALTSSGAMRWLVDMPADLVSSPAVARDNTVYVSSIDGKLHALSGSSSLAEYGWPKTGRDMKNTGRAQAPVNIMPVLSLLLLNDKTEPTSLPESTKLEFNSVRADNQLASSSDEAWFSFTLDEAATVALLSSGGLDLQADVFLSDAKTPLVGDDGNSHSNGYTDILDEQYDNFMFRLGSYNADLGRRALDAGTYFVRVKLDTDAVSGGEYSLLLLKRGEGFEGFVDPMRELLLDGDESNDYLDIFMKALYPDVYATVGSDPNCDYDGSNYPEVANWSGLTYCWGDVHWSRQCKALNNVFQLHVRGQGRLQSDSHIRSNFDSVEGASVLRDGGAIVYNSQTDPVTGSTADAHGGDHFVVYHSTYNHYGLYADDNEGILDSNRGGDGRLRLSTDWSPQTPLKIARPE